MKNFAHFITAAALAAAVPAALLTPVATARHVANVEHRSAPSSYACIKNLGGAGLSRMRIVYKRYNFNGWKWENSPWSKAVTKGQTTCIGLSKAKAWTYFKIEANTLGLFTRNHHCGTIRRGEAKRNDSKHPAHVSYDFWSQVARSSCKAGPWYWNKCNKCKYKDWSW
ncbi:MAG: hypothetical protein HAW59_03250 [Betaproteobacteria bacterium]|nr:hypothetical protein [Betaproteobacteria bacterium]